MSTSIARKRLLVLWVAVVAVGLGVGLAVSWWAGLAVFLLGDAVVLLRFSTVARESAERREALEQADLAPAPPGRAIWRFTSWHGRASTSTTRRSPRDASPTPGKGTYTPYEPAVGDSDGSADSAPEG